MRKKLKRKWLEMTWQDTIETHVSHQVNRLNNLAPSTEAKKFLFFSFLKCILIHHVYLHFIFFFLFTSHSKTIISFQNTWVSYHMSNNNLFPWTNFFLWFLITIFLIFMTHHSSSLSEFHDYREFLMYFIYSIF